MSPGPRRPKLPTGIRRILARLPVHLFRIGLGPVFLGRLLLLTHTGRTSGLPRQTVLEVVAHDPLRRTWTLASGFGPKAQWYRNLRHSPQAVITVGRRRYPVTARFLDPGEGGRIMAEYAPKRPRAARLLCSYMGFPTDGSTETFQAAGEQIPFVRMELIPRQEEPTAH
ncbi:nitroreductase family deazaflavin-dependent oxidoreductase [Streptomyces sp. NPDC051561]|uniref:nitroreductase family deazaflavin-dependent oxidoreductase n=1 Tax=Streptomyces sp. NPDC051561 TaxID=3365658 RepID=UPI0037B8ADB1